MASPRFQFRLSTLLWITLAVACWFGGTAWQRRETRQEIELVWAEKEAAKRAIEIKQGQALGQHYNKMMDKIMSEQSGERASLNKYRNEMMEKIRTEKSAVKRDEYLSEMSDKMRSMQQSVERSADDGEIGTQPRGTVP